MEVHASNAPTTTMAQTGKRTLSEAEESVVNAGRAALLSQWAARPFSDGQPSNFDLEYIDTLISSQGLIDRFRTESAADAPSSAWARQRLRHDIDYTIGASSAMTVHVPHAYYFKQLHLPLWCNRACLQDVSVLLAMATALGALSWVVAGFEPIVSLRY